MVKHLSGWEEGSDEDRWETAEKASARSSRATEVDRQEQAITENKENVEEPGNGNNVPEGEGDNANPLLQPETLTSTGSVQGPPFERRWLHHRNVHFAAGIFLFTFVGSFWIWSHYHDSHACDRKLDQERYLHNAMHMNKTLDCRDQMELLKDSHRNTTIENSVETQVLQKEVEELRNRVEDAQKEVASNKEIIQEKDTKIRELEEKLENLMKENSMLQKEVATRGGLIQELTSTLQMRSGGDRPQKKSLLFQANIGALFIFNRYYVFDARIQTLTY